MTEGSRWDSASSELWGLVPESDFKGAQSSLWRQGLLTGIFEQGQDFQSFLLAVLLESDDKLKDFLAFRMQAYFNERLRFYILWNLKLSPEDRLQIGHNSLCEDKLYFTLGSQGLLLSGIFEQGQDFRCLILPVPYWSWMQNLKNILTFSIILFQWVKDWDSTSFEIAFCAQLICSLETIDSLVVATTILES